MKLTWNEGKRKINLAKHGFDFVLKANIPNYPLSVGI
jgi:uncharacterized DUF497 family protein